MYKLNFKGRLVAFRFLWLTIYLQLHVSVGLLRIRPKLVSSFVYLFYPLLSIIHHSSFSTSPYPSRFLFSSSLYTLLLFSLAFSISLSLSLSLILRSHLELMKTPETAIFQVPFTKSHRSNSNEPVFVFRSVRVAKGTCSLPLFSLSLSLSPYDSSHSPPISLPHFLILFRSLCHTMKSNIEYRAKSNKISLSVCGTS